MKKQFCQSFKYFLTIIMIITVIGNANAQILECSPNSMSQIRSHFNVQEQPITYPISFLDIIKEDDPEKKANRMQLWKGISYGALSGAIIGAAIGGFGKDWVLTDGTIVPRITHVLVDAVIFAFPTLTGGMVIGCRRDRSGLSPSKFHFALAGGYSSAFAFRDMENAFISSGLPAETPHWFGYLHYPNGDDRSVPYTWNGTFDYSITEHLSTGITFNKIVMQEVIDSIITPQNHLTYDEADHNYEFAKGVSYLINIDWIINPITPDNPGRLEFASGTGVALSFLTFGGHLDSLGTDFEDTKTMIAPYLRYTVDYYARKNLSLQSKFAFKFNQRVDVPEQTGGTIKLLAHQINFMAIDFTVGVRYHFN